MDREAYTEAVVRQMNGGGTVKEEDEKVKLGSECGLAIAPYFIFTNINIPVPRYGITTLLHVNRLEQGRVSQGSKQLPF